MSVNWEAVAVTVGGLGTLGVPLVIGFTRHVGRIFETKAHHVVQAATAALTERIEASDRLTEQRIGEVKTELAATKDKLTRVEMQFGPNGGGMRQKVDEIGRDVTAVAASQDGLTARFEDHLSTSADDRRRLAAVEHALLKKGVGG